MKKKKNLYLVPLLTCKLVKERTIRLAADKISHPLDVLEISRKLIAEADREHMLAFLANARNEIVGVHTVGIGGLSQMCTSPKEVFRAALVAGASGIILAHNHPSGDPSASPEDIAFTKRCATAGKIIGISILDHVVVSRSGFFSFLASGILPKGEDVP